MWLADSATGLDATLPQWLQAVGVITLLASLVVAFIRGWLVSGSFHRSALAEKDKVIADKDQRIEALEVENREQTLFLRDQAAPLLTRTTDVLARVLEEQRFEERQRRG